MFTWSGNAAQAAAATASRLRLLQTHLADAPEPDRTRSLNEAVKEALAEVPPPRQEEFLRELEGQFPTWSVQSPAPAGEPSAGHAVPASAAPPAEVNDWTWLLARLLEKAVDLAPADREALMNRLDSAGLVRQAAGVWPAAEEAKLRDRLRPHLPPNKAIDPARLLHVAAMLADIAIGVDGVAWEKWRQIAEKTDFRKNLPDYRTVLSQYLTGSQTFSRGQIEAEAVKTKNLAVALLTSSRVVHQFADQWWSNRLSPEAIKNATSKPGWSPAAAYWATYERLNAEMSGEKIEHDILDAMRRHIDEILGNAPQSGH